jgi:hypothetical protein
MTDRYVIANVSLPLRIHPDGSISHLTEYMSVTLETRDKLPDDLPPSNASAEFAKLMQQIFVADKPNDPPQTPTPDRPTHTLNVTPLELNARSAKPPVHNTSFKAKRHAYNRHTVKNYPSS